MDSKPKFKPVVTRVRLNPEEAVLLRSCYDINARITVGSSTGGTDQWVSDIFCNPKKRNHDGGAFGSTMILKKTGTRLHHGLAAHNA